MTTYRKLYYGISKAAWGYLFIYFSIDINNISLLPDFIGYLLFLSAINSLKDEERDLSLLRTLGILLVIWHGAVWLASLVSIDIGEISRFVGIIVCLVDLYFHFQLLTNLASIAAKYQPEGFEQDAKLLRYRTIQTVMLTAIMILTYHSSRATETWTYIIFITAITLYLIAGVCLMKALFDLRKCLPKDDGSM